MSAAPARPQFCPWCGSPAGYEGHDHEPRHHVLAERAREQGAAPPPLPERVEEVLAGESWVSGCPGCRMVSHVVGHRAQTG